MVGIPQSMPQSSVSDPAVMSHLRSASNNAAHLHRAGAEGAKKAAHEPLAREPVTTRSPRANPKGPLGTTSVIVYKCWLWIMAYNKLQQGETSQGEIRILLPSFFFFKKDLFRKILIGRNIAV